MNTNNCQLTILTTALGGQHYLAMRCYRGRDRRPSLINLLPPSTSLFYAYGSLLTQNILEERTT